MKLFAVLTVVGGISYSLGRAPERALDASGRSRICAVGAGIQDRVSLEEDVEGFATINCTALSTAGVDVIGCKLCNSHVP